MNRSKSFIVLLILISLALVGAGTSLISDPKGFLSTILIAIIIFCVVLFVFNKLSGSPNQSAYKKAAKQSKKLMQKKTRG